MNYTEYQRDKRREKRKKIRELAAAFSKLGLADVLDLNAELRKHKMSVTIHLGVLAAATAKDTGT